MRKSITVDTGLEKALDSVTLVAPGDHLFTSGIAPDRPGSLESQTRQVFQRVAGLLHDAGSSLDDTVRTRAFFTVRGGEAAIWAVHAGVFGNRGPALSTIRMTCLPREAGVVVEVEAVKGAGKAATRHRPKPEWGTCHAVNTGREIFVCRG
jgi:enamine deaminase RidA (YjgF/YER057c/UK114 family)